MPDLNKLEQRREALRREIAELTDVLRHYDRAVDQVYREMREATPAPVSGRLSW